MIIREKVAQSIINLFRVNLCLSEGERALILADAPTPNEWNRLDLDFLTAMTRRVFLARIVGDVAKEAFRTNSIEVYIYPSVGGHGRDLPDDVATKMLASDVVVGITTYSLTHTAATKKATEAGVRVISMPSVEPDMFYPGGAIDADYKAIAKDTIKMFEYLVKTDVVYIRSDDGTDLSFSIKGRKCWAETGILAKDSQMKIGNLPAGEASVAPVEGTAEGVIVVKANWYPRLNTDMVLLVSKGLVKDVQGGGSVGEELRNLLKPQEQQQPYILRRNIAELGIGTNPNAKRTDNVLEAEKIKGTVHIGIGSNFFLGGNIKTDLHTDFVIPKPDVMFDDKPVIKKGTWLI
jgi:leucyl aminopeptidase (aminopeptidase T)